MLKWTAFKHAWAGLTHYTRTENHGKFHFIFGLMIVILSFTLELDKYEWISVLICIALVVVSEIINSALEGLTDIASPQIQDSAKNVKDMAAAAVLFASFIASIVGLVIFVPKVMSFL